MAPMGPFCKPRVKTRGYDFVYGLTSFGFDHNFDHNEGRLIWSVLYVSLIARTEKQLRKELTDRKCEPSFLYDV